MSISTPRLTLVHQPARGQRAQEQLPVQAHRASHEAGLPTEGQVDALEALEATYASLYGRQQALLESRFDIEEVAA